MAAARPRRTNNVQVLVDDAKENLKLVLQGKAQQQLKGIFAQPEVVFVLSVGCAREKGE